MHIFFCIYHCKSTFCFIINLSKFNKINTFPHYSKLIIMHVENFHALIRSFFCFLISLPFLNIRSSILFNLSFILLILNIFKQIISSYLYYHSIPQLQFFLYYQSQEIVPLNLTSLLNVSKHFDTNKHYFYNHLICHNIILNLCRIKIFRLYQQVVNVSYDIIKLYP